MSMSISYMSMEISVFSTLLSVGTPESYAGATPESYAGATPPPPHTYHAFAALKPALV